MLMMSQTGYSKYETGENDIPTAVLIKLSRFYGTSIDYLLGETDDPKPYRNHLRNRLLPCPLGRAFFFFLQKELENAPEFARKMAQSGTNGTVWHTVPW